MYSFPKFFTEFTQKIKQRNTKFCKVWQTKIENFDNFYRVTQTQITKLYRVTQTCIGWQWLIFFSLPLILVQWLIFSLLLLFRSVHPQKIFLLSLPPSFSPTPLPALTFFISPWTTILFNISTIRGCMASLSFSENCTS